MFESPDLVENFFTGLLYEQDFFWVQSGRLKTTSEAKMKCIGGLKNFYEDLKKKFGQEKRQNHAFFKIKISVKSAFLAKHLDFRVL